MTHHLKASPQYVACFYLFGGCRQINYAKLFNPYWLALYEMRGKVEGQVGWGALVENIAQDLYLRWHHAILVVFSRLPIHSMYNERRIYYLNWNITALFYTDEIYPLPLPPGSRETRMQVFRLSWKLRKAICVARCVPAHFQNQTPSAQIMKKSTLFEVNLSSQTKDGILLHQLPVANY